MLAIKIGDFPKMFFPKMWHFKRKLSPKPEIVLSILKGWRFYTFFQVVASGILYVVMHGNPEKTCLCRVMETLLRKLSPQSWDVLHMNVMWNIKKPVWFQALLDLLEPYFFPIIDDLLDDVEAGRTWTLGHVPAAIDKMNANILDISHLIPASFYQVS